MSNVRLINREIAHLAQATQLISDGELRILRQRVLIAGLRADGHDTHQAERILTEFLQALGLWNAHRGLIEECLARVAGSGVGGPRSGKHVQRRNKGAIQASPSGTLGLAAVPQMQS